MESNAAGLDWDTLKARVAQQDQLIDALRFEIAQLKRLLFGRRSEQLAAPIDTHQLSLWNETPEDAPAVSPVTFKTVTASPAKGQPKRMPLPAHLPREIVVLPLSPEQRACPACGSDRPVIGYDTAERLDYVPA
jgi:transposase